MLRSKLSDGVFSLLKESNIWENIGIYLKIWLNLFKKKEV